MQKEVFYQQISKSGSAHDVKYIRTKFISEELINTWQEMLKSGVKRKDICAQYKISMPTLRKYCGGKFQLQKKQTIAEMVQTSTTEAPQELTTVSVQPQANN